MFVPSCEIDQKYFALLASIAVNNAACVSLYFGNISTYIYSIEYYLSSSDSFDISPSWMLPMYLVSKIIGTFLLEVIKRNFGLRVSSAIGILTFLASICLTAVTIKHSVWATTLTFMVGGGIGCGIIQTCSMIYLAGWFSSNIGLAFSIPVSAASIGGFIMNILITSYINPQNLNPDITRGNLRLFSQRCILDRVPTAFMLLGSITSGLLIIAFIFMKKPPRLDVDEDVTISMEEQRGLSVESVVSSGKGGAHSYINEKGEHPNDLKIDSCTSQSTSASSSNRSAPVETIDDYHQTNTPIKELSGASNQTSKCLNKKASNEEEKSENPLNILTSKKFYTLGLAVTAQSFGFVVVVNYFKLYGQLWIKNDQFLALVGSCASLCAIAFLLGCGKLIDAIGPKNTLIVHLSASAILLSLWYFMALPDGWLYLIWTVVVFGFHNSLIVLVPLLVLKVFGKRHFATNYGLVQSASILVYLLGPIIIRSILRNLGWFWLFFVTGCVSFSALFPVLLCMPS